jgi:hypothetical protein
MIIVEWLCSIELPLLNASNTAREKKRCPRLHLPFYLLAEEESLVTSDPWLNFSDE